MVNMHISTSANSLDFLKGKTGVYTLIILIEKSITQLEIGKLGKCDFHKGIYIYTGSAVGKGSSSLYGRISRHISMKKKLYWHIDYLLSSSMSNLKYIIYSETENKKECEIVQNMYLFSPKSAISKFGSSDCNSGCPSHLQIFDCDIKNVIEIVRKAYERADLKPEFHNLSI